VIEYRLVVTISVFDEVTVFVDDVTRLSDELFGSSSKGFVPVGVVAGILHLTVKVPPIRKFNGESSLFSDVSNDFGTVPIPSHTEQKTTTAPTIGPT
jgi:hypothetical protein